VLPALALLAAAAVARAVYPRLLERRQESRRALGPDGIVLGASPIHLERRDATGVLLIHGGGDTPQALAAMATFLHSKGLSVRVPLLSGHGRRLSALTEVSAARLYADVSREFDALRSTHECVAVVGLSMGGALALQLAAERHVDALVLLAPYVGMPRPIRGLALASFAWGWLAPYFSSLGSRSIRDPVAAGEALGHGIMTPALLRALYEVTAAAERALPRVTAPTLVIQSREDNRITPEIAELGFARLGSVEKKLVWTDGAAHVISVDFGHHQVFELVSAWLTSHC
jgi:carboxylesterase